MKLRTWLIWADIICTALAVLIFTVAVVRSIGNIVYPVWLLAPWRVLAILLAVIVEIHVILCLLVSWAKIGEEEARQKRLGIPPNQEPPVVSFLFIILFFLSISFPSLAMFQIFSQVFESLSIELLVIFIGLCISDIFFVIPFVKNTRTIRELLPTRSSVESDQEQK
jgi:hypothetical protein